MEREFIPYQEALALKELGFDEPCFGYYLEDGTWVPASYSKESTVYPSNSDLLSEWCSAPLYQQAFRWFREKYSLGHMINGIGFETFLINIGGIIKVFPMFNTYEEAELACLRMLIELVKTFNSK
jgi:hypothetical protein